MFPCRRTAARARHVEGEAAGEFACAADTEAA